jgi:3-methyl-2-oxobutanoate hydroxymethyltransferase
MRRPKVTTASLREMKASRERIVTLTAYDFTMAHMLDGAGADVLLVGDSLGTVVQGRDTTVPVTMDHMVYHCEMVSRASTRALVIGDMPFLSYQISAEDALRNAGRLLKEGGVEAVKLEGGVAVAGTVRRLVDAGIAVMGHVGLTPQSIHQFGSYKVRGETAEQAKQILDDALAIEAAGAFGLVIEKVPAALGKQVTQRLSIPTIGIGAGADCDGQVLVTHDMLGLFTAFRPRFVRRYAELAMTIDEAVRRFGDDVRAGRFPAAGESY